MNNKSKSVIIVVVASFLALLGIVAENLVNRYWQKEFLRFGTPVVAREIQGAESAKSGAGVADDETAGRFYALSGLIVRHGDIVDAVSPIFAAVSLDGAIEAEKLGRRYGGEGGLETRLVQPGYLITEVRMIRGDYFGATHLIHLEVVWQKLIRDGFNVASKLTSQRLGDGTYAKHLRPPVVYRAPEGHYISDLLVPPALRHTSGELYLTDLVAEYKPLPIRGSDRFRW